MAVCRTGGEDQDRLPFNDTDRARTGLLLISRTGLLLI